MEDRGQVGYTLENFKQKLYSMIIVNDNHCWVFKGYKTPQGYGKIRSKRFFPKESLAHRISYLLNSVFTLPSELCVLHKCDNPPCINPDHLFIGTRDLNNKDRATKGRTITPTMNLTHCKRGHEFTKENTIIRNTGTRLCRTCNNNSARRRQKEYRNALR